MIDEFGICGVYRHAVDAKGRLAMPSRLREDMGDVYYVTISTEKCLTAYSQEGWKTFLEKAKGISRVQMQKIRPIFAHAAKCELDGQGRILLPQTLRQFAGLEKNVAIVGSGEYAEIWDEETWNKVDAIESTPENMAEVFGELGL